MVLWAHVCPHPRCVVVVGMPYPNIKSPELQEKVAYLDHTLVSTSRSWGDARAGQGQLWPPGLRAVTPPTPDVCVSSRGTGALSALELLVTLALCP